MKRRKVRDRKLADRANALPGGAGVFTRPTVQTWRTGDGAPDTVEKLELLVLALKLGSHDADALRDAWMRRRYPEAAEHYERRIRDEQRRANVRERLTWGAASFEEAQILSRLRFNGARYPWLPAAMVRFLDFGFSAGPDGEPRTDIPDTGADILRALGSEFARPAWFEALAGVARAWLTESDGWQLSETEEHAEPPSKVTVRWLRDAGDGKRVRTYEGDDVKVDVAGRLSVRTTGGEWFVPTPDEIGPIASEPEENEHA